MSDKAYDWSAPTIVVWMGEGRTPNAADFLRNPDGHERMFLGLGEAVDLVMEAPRDGQPAAGAARPWLRIGNETLAPGDLDALVDARRRGG